MSDQIPLDYTVTFSGLPSVFDSTIPPSDVAGIPPITSDTVFPLEKVGQGDIDGTFRVTGRGLKDWLLAGLGNIREWVVDEFYYTTRMDVTGTILYPPDIVSHDNNLYVVLQDFQAGATFDEHAAGGVTLDRITKDSDLQYNEITAAAFEPFVASQVVGQYTTIRSFSILKEYPFPNSNLGTPQQWHVALCNATIDSPVVIDIKRRNFAVGVTTIGTITFTPNVDDPHQILGVLDFNDPNSGSQAATRLFMGAGDSLFFTLNTTSPTLEWVSINLIGEFIQYTSPYINVPL